MCKIYNLFFCLFEGKCSFIEIIFRQFHWLTQSLKWHIYLVCQSLPTPKLLRKESYKRFRQVRYYSLYYFDVHEQ